MGSIPRSTRLPSLALLCLFLPLAGCEAMNQVTVLDRLFEPERYGRKPAPVQASRPAPSRRPAPAPAVVAMQPRPDPVAVPVTHQPSSPVKSADPEAGLRQTVRQHPWLTRFWSELRVTEQARIARNLPAAEDLPGTWDSMGLADRARLVALPAAEDHRWASGP